MNVERRQYRTRMFGTREDPGTGGASCALGCWLSGLEGKGESRFIFEQGVKMRRRNEIVVEVMRGEGVERVILTGCAVVAMEGKLEVKGVFRVCGRGGGRMGLFHYNIFLV